jgi:hypothetical protein
VAKARPSSGPTAISTSAFATIPSNGTAPNWSQRIGAVETLQAAEMATAAASFACTG